MRIILSATALFFYLHSTSQVINKAKAYQNTYASWSRPCYGLMSNGHIYFAGFINHYDSLGVPQNMEVFRLDMNTGNVIYKTIQTPSSQSALWIWENDSLGNVWMGVISGQRAIWKFNFKTDTIFAKNYGNGFPDDQAMAYSISLGRDNHMYFGASSGGTYWCEYDPVADSLVQHPVINGNQNYVLNILGDSLWAYAQIGQDGSNDFYAIRKSDNSATKLFSCPTNTRFDCKVMRNACYVGNPVTGRKYRLSGKDTTFVTSYGTSGTVYYNEIGGTGQPKITGNYFDPTTNILSYSTNTGLNNNVSISSQNVLANIGFLITDRADTSKIYFIGDYYGAWYTYDRTLDTSYVLGKGFGNVYSYVQMNDSLFAIGCYPSGLVAEWNKNKAWDVGIYDTTTKVVSGLSTTSNPRFICYMKNTPAGFHHVYGLVYDSVKNILIGSGNVDRIGNGVSLAVHNLNTHQTYGYDFNKIPSSNNYRYLTLSGRDAILTTSGTNARIYFYNYVDNVMKDSIVYNGWTNYGKVYAVGSTILGIANNRYYKINMAKNKELFYDSTVAGITNYFHTMLPDARIAINGWVQPPSNFWQWKYLGNNGSMPNYTGTIGSYYTYYGKNITQTKNMTLTPVNLATAIGKEQFVKRLRNN